MNKDDFEKQFWFFYMDIEEEFLEIGKTIPIDQINRNTFSFKYAKLLQLICSEIDVTFKRLMDFKNYSYKKGNILTYESFIQKHFNEFKSSIITCYKSSHNYEIIKPFEKWTSQSSPRWWAINHQLTHNRNELDGFGIEQYKHANQYTVLNALAGLFILLMYFYEEIIHETSPEEQLRVPLPQSEIFHLENWGNYYEKIIANRYYFEITDGQICVTAPDK